MTDRTHAELARLAIDEITTFQKLTESLCKQFVGGREWSFPLSDGVYVSVKVHGDYRAAHLHVFAKLFTAVANSFVVEPEQGTLSTGGELRQPEAENA